MAELEQLLPNTTRERFRAQLMFALYRSGRQPEALGVYRSTREVLMQEFGIEPTPRLHELERAILTQDPALDLGGGAVEADRTVLVLSADEVELDELLAIAEPLTSTEPRELIVARLLADESALRHGRLAEPSVRIIVGERRSAAFTIDGLARHRAARDVDVELVLLGLSQVEDALPTISAEILDTSPADVALLAGHVDVARGDGVFVPIWGQRTRLGGAGARSLVGIEDEGAVAACRYHRRSATR